MSRLGQTLLKTLALTVALLFLVGVVATAGWQYLFGTKIGQLYGMSADALAEDSRPTHFRVGADGKWVPVDGGATLDAGAPDAGEPIAPTLDGERRGPRYFDASKSGVFRLDPEDQVAPEALDGGP